MESAFRQKGQKRVTVRTSEGQTRRVNWEVCKVNRALMSVALITASGNIVHLAEQSPHIKNIKTGQVTKLRKERNVFVIDLWVKVETRKKAVVKVDDGDGDVQMQRFQRRGS